MYKPVPVIIACALLAGCASQDAFKTLYALDGAYATAATAEATYCGLPVRDAAACALMKQYDDEAYGALAPLTVAASRSGGSIDSVALAAAEVAVTKFATFANQKVKP